MAEEAKSAAEVAYIVDLHPKTLLKMARRGEVPARKLGRRWIFTESSLVEWRDRGLHSNCHPVTSREEIQ